jgi:F0F1-type ATP synthase epsilon subunit
MFPPLRLRVMTVAGVLLEAVGVRWVKAELADGMAVSIWPGHAPLLAQTARAPLRYADSRGEHAELVEEGILHVEDGVVTIYTAPASGFGAGETAGDDDGEPGEA